MKNENIIVFGEDFARHPHALEHLLRPLFECNRFLWVETIGLRAPRLSLYDLKRIFFKFTNWFFPSSVKTQKNIPPNISILSPFMIPYNKYGFIRKFNQWNVNREIKKSIKLLDMKNIISIASVPNACDYIGFFNERLKIYYCVDEFSLWPGLDYTLVKTLEEQLISKVDLIIATSTSLSQSKTVNGVPCPMITHGVEFEHFNIGTKTINHVPIKLCYFGLFDERTDQSLLLQIVKEISFCELNIIGDVVCDTTKLNNNIRIKFHGKVSYKELPFAIKPMDIFLLPYKKNQLTNNINPLKLKEYLSTGRPVIAIDLPEVVKMKEYLYLAQDASEFIKIINNISNNSIKLNPEKTLQYVQANETWISKTKLLCKIMNEKDEEMRHEIFHQL